MAQSDILNTTAITLIKLMETEGMNWTKPWTTTTKNNGQPISIRKREYNGINRWILGMEMAINGYTSPVFATFQKWKEVGAKIKKGSTSHEVVFFKTLFKSETNDKGEEEQIKIPLLKTYRVFNADQVEGWDGNWLTDGEEQTQDWNDVELADLIVENSGAEINHVNQDKAFYMPSQDMICMPEKAQFKDDSGYYGTMFHELVHWTGHSSRLDRKFGTRKGNDNYAKEELVAELGAAMLSAIAKVDAEPRADHAQYLNGWIKGLKDQPKMILTAASKAEKAAQFIIDQSTQNSKEVGELIAA
jgi:antirestriction protein ArdC